MTRTITIPSAVERYLDERREDVSDSTLYNHSSQLKQFIEWCDSEDERPEKVAGIDNWLVSDFKVDRRDSDNLSDTALYNQMSVLRVFLRWCESRSLIEDVSANIMMPQVENRARNEKMDVEHGDTVLEKLRTYEYGTLKHAVFALLWTTGLRAGSIIAIDVDDYHSEEMYVDIVHRPEKGTPLKNKSDGEREVNLHEWVCVIIDDYLDAHRNDVADENGRQPLFTTSNGRIHRNTLRKRVRAITRPCEYSKDCPHDRVIEECEATQYNKACQCPSSVSPHPVRRSAITNHLNNGHSKELLSDRMDVSVKVLEEHYDARTEGEKRELRREMFDM